MTVAVHPKRSTIVVFSHSNKDQDELEVRTGVSAMHTVQSIVAHQHSMEAHNPREREKWGNDVQFVLACIGYVVGLGNIWRFPSLAYEHGGGAFLLPYLICSILFGLPLILLEQSIGQYTQAGPAVGLAYYAPALQGVGWSMSLVGGTVAMYYNVVVAWSALYIVTVLTGKTDSWSSCRNEWNTPYCESSLEDIACLSSTNGTLGYYFNGSCHLEIARGTMNKFSAVSPAEEFFERYITQKSDGMGDLGGMNWKVLISLFFVWCLVAACMSRGVEWIGKLAYFTATSPYLIIAAFFVRGITLDGSYEGLQFYLLQPDFSHLFKIATWKAALTHCCFSLSIGFGGIMAMSSYNEFHHNCYSDVLTIICADNFMNVFGGTAVFATIGFMAKQLNKPVAEVVQSGTSLIFVAYPEAMSRMPLTSFWAFLFFFMLFVLGITTSFGYTQVLVTCLRDRFPSLHPHRAIVTCAVCLFFFTGGIIICSNAGIYWFNVYNDFTGSTCICLVAMVELVWMSHIYEMAGKYGRLQWALYFVIAPVLGTIVLISRFIRDPLTYGKGERIYVYPWWSSVFGWLLVTVPVLFMPVVAVSEAIRYRRSGKSLKELFAIQPPLRSYRRIKARNSCEGSMRKDSETEEKMQSYISLDAIP